MIVCASVVANELVARHLVLKFQRMFNYSM